jgi:hypothetical protein
MSREEPSINGDDLPSYVGGSRRGKEESDTCHVRVPANEQVRYVCLTRLDGNNTLSTTLEWYAPEALANVTGLFVA